MYPRIKIRKVEDLSGNGSLVGQDQRIYPVSYWIFIRQEMIQPMANDAWIPGLFDITGKISPSTSFPPFNLQEQYILRLKDGTEFEVFITRWSSGSPYCEIAVNAGKDFFDRYK